MAIDDEAAAVAPEVAARLAAGESVERVARWLYLGPAGRRPILAIKALRVAGIGLAEGKRLVDEVMADVAPEELVRWVVALRQDAIEAMDTAEDQDR